MKKNTAQKDILYISISSFVLVVLWIGFNLYHAYATSTIEPDLRLQIEHIDPQFNTRTLDKLKSRKTIVPVYQLDSASTSAEPSPTPAAPALEQSPTPGGSFLIQGQ
ncbi:MAG TPA: hypothetical protein VNA13_02405 [Xanthomonadales bacterium]|nr:hypothetical protein [Xanthomonadales bacterium]